MKTLYKLTTLIVCMSILTGSPTWQNKVSAEEVTDYNILGSIGGPTSSLVIHDECVYVGKGTSIMILKNREGSLSQVGGQITLPSYVTDLQMEGDTLYAAAGSAGLHIFDISDPLQPEEHGSYTSAGFAESVAIKDNTAYLANGREGLQVIDITDLDNPVPRGQIHQGKYAFHVELDDNYAYIAASEDGLLIADLSDSFDPKPLGVVNTPGIARNVLVEGGFAYIADDWKGVSIIDISNPLKPKSVTTIPTAGRAYGIALSKEYLYIADAYMGLRVFDIHNLSDPKDITSFVPNESQMSGVYVDQEMLFCTDRINGVMCFNISNPSNLVLKGFYSHAVPIPQVLPDCLQHWSNKKEITRLIVIGVLKESELNPEKEITKAELAQLLCRSLRLEAAPKSKKGTYKDVPVSHWAYGYIEKAVKLGLISSLDKTHFAPDSSMTYGEVVKCLLRLVNHAPKSGTKITDYIQEANKLGLSSVTARSDNTGNVLRSNALAMLEKIIFEVTDAKTKKTLLESKFGIQLQAFPMAAIDTAVKDNYAYILSGYSGFSVVDISIPSNMRQVAHLDIPEPAIYIRILGSYAYVFANYDLYVVDIKNPLYPVRTYAVNSQEGGPARGISIDGDRMYVADEWGVKIYSITDPGKPALLAFHKLLEGSDLANSTSDIAVRGGIAYVAFAGRGIEIYDFSDYSKAKYCGSYLGADNLSFIPNVQFEDDLAVVNCFNRIELLDITDILKPKYLCSIDQLQSQQNNTRGGISGTSLFYPNGTEGIITAELSELTSDKAPGFIDTPGIPVNVTIAGNRGYVSDSLGGMCVISKAGEDTQSATQQASISTAGRISCSFNIDIFQGEKAEQYVLSGKKAETVLMKAGKSFTETLIVKNTKDNGTGSLSWCIDNIKQGGRILFDPLVFPPSKPATIYSTTGLCLNRIDNITIDASNAGVVLDGSRADRSTMGINILTNGNIIRGLQIQRFQNCSIYIAGSDNIIGGSRFKGKGPTGEGNVIINGDGMGIYGQKATGNIIVGNNIGLEADGKTAAANKDGIALRNLASRNIIGIDKPEYRNVISANQNNGVSSMGEAFGNLIEGNYIGTDITGMTGLGNNNHGISSELCGGFGNIVKNNVVSGNRRCGILLWDNRASYNVIISNISGLSADGNKELPNQWCSMAIGGGVGGGSFYNVIGGRTEYQNIINKDSGGTGISVDTGIYDTIINGEVYKHKDEGKY